jgi:hypothetical protein
MRTTINVNDRLLADAKRLAQESGMTLTAVIEDALRERLARRSAVSQAGDDFHLCTFTGQGLQPGIDLDDSAALLDLMDAPA